jgi:hypothetical protein
VLGQLPMKPLVLACLRLAVAISSLVIDFVCAGPHTSRACISRWAGADANHRHASATGTVLEDPRSGSDRDLSENQYILVVVPAALHVVEEPHVLHGVNDPRHPLR